MIGHLAPKTAMKTFTSFDHATIAYHDEGEGFPVILLHGYGVDGLGQFGSFERIVLILEKRQKLFIETFGEAPPMPACRWTRRTNPAAVGGEGPRDSALLSPWRL